MTIVGHASLLAQIDIGWCCRGQRVCFRKTTEPQVNTDSDPAGSAEFEMWKANVSNGRQRLQTSRRVCKSSKTERPPDIQDELKRTERVLTIINRALSGVD